MAVKKGLGRGLDALISLGAPERLLEPEAGGKLRSLPVDLIQRGRYQPRTEIRPEPLQELADSIRAQGIVQPIVVRPMADGNRYEIVAGERRWRAAQLAGLHEIPAIVRDISERAAMSIALIENLQREDLNPLEEAAALFRLTQEFEMTHQEVADAVGRSRAAVSNLLRLLDLAEEVKRMVERGELEMGHARALLALEGPLQAQAAQRIASQGLSVREAERLIRRQAREHSPRAPRERDPNVAQLEDDLSGKLGTRVAVRHDGKAKGTIVIHYNSLDELDGILAHIR